MAGNWKGGVTRTHYGYLAQRDRDHPHAKSGYVLQHRLVAEAHLRATDPESSFLLDGYLHPGTDVHHANGIKDDNRIENLVVLWRGDHTRHHHAALHAARWSKPYADEWFDGAKRTLTMGEDVEATDWRGLNSSLHRAARKRGKYVALKQTSATTFTIQARDR